MLKTEPRPNLVNFEQLRLTGSRTVEIAVRNVILTVTENLADDPTVEAELGRTRMALLKGSEASIAVLMLPSRTEGEEPSATEREKEASLLAAIENTKTLSPAVMFDRRRIICRRISTKFVSWNVVGVDGKAMPLDFDSLYDGPIDTDTLELIFVTVQNEPIVGE